MILFYVLIFIVSCGLLFWSGSFLVGALMRMAKFLGWREFVVAFFVMAFAGSAPNLFVGISSALHKIPQLSFGEIVGGNVIDLTLAIALATLIAKGLPAKSRLVQGSSIFTIIIAILPILLILDGILSRGDGIILILVFFFYIFWLFSKKERFTKIYDVEKEIRKTDKDPLEDQNIYDKKNLKRRAAIIRKFKVFIKDLGKVILGVLCLLLSAEGIVSSASFFAENLNLPVALIGILIVGLGNALPEIYFAIASARKSQTWMILGNLMGSVIVPATLVLGTVALIYPIKIVDFSPFAIARLFLIISALFFIFFVKTDRKITKKEALILLGIYILFVICEILI